MSKVFVTGRALLVLLALLVGLPAVLMLAGPPLLQADSWATFDQIVSGPDHLSGVLLVLRVLGWVLWAYFVAGFIAALVAALRSRSVHVTEQKIHLGWSQKQAAGLIAAIVVVLPGVSATAAMASTPAAPSVATVMTTASVQAPEGQANSIASGKSVKESPDSQTRVYHVKKGDTPWSIAEAELGSGSRASEIVELNADRPQPGGTSLGQSKWPKKGWTLLLPADGGASAPSDVADADVRKVKPGDTLWGYAEDAYGDGEKYRKIYKANKGKPQPSGQPLSDPNVIVTGDRIVVPGAGAAMGSTQGSKAGEVRARSSELAPDPAARSLAGVEEDAITEAQPAPVEAPPAAAPAPAPPVAGQAPAVAAPPTLDEPAPAPAPVEPPQVVEDGSIPAAAAQPPMESDQGPLSDSSPESEEDNEDVSQYATAVSPGLLALGGATALGLLALLGAKRVRQRRKQRPGQSIPTVPEAALEPERWLRELADPATSRAMRHALRGLCEHFGRTNQPLPSLLFARSDQTSLTLWFTQPVELPTPWAVANSSASSWSITHADATAREDFDELSALVAAPWPALVTVGRDEHGGELLIDLEYAGALTVTGEGAEPTQVLRALAVSLAVGNFADYLQVTVVGFCSELPAALGNGVVRYQPTVGHLIEELSQRAHEDRVLMVEDGATDVAHARAAGLAADTHSPEIIILGMEPSQTQRADLEELVEGLPRVAVAAIAVGDSALTDWALRLSAEGTATLEPMGLVLTPAAYSDQNWDGQLAGLNSADLAPIGTPTRVSDVVSRDEFDLFEPVEPVESDAAAVEEALSEEFVPAQEPQHMFDDSAPGVTELSDVAQPSSVTVSVAPDLAVVAGVTSQSNGGNLVDEQRREINILGKVEIRGWPPVPAELLTAREQMESLATYIVVNPGTNQRSLLTTFWQEWLNKQAQPGAKRAVKKPSSDAISKLRKWIGGSGRAEAGARWLPKATTYTFSDEVVCDWDVFQELTAHGAPEKVEDTAQLTRALGLVRGAPFANAGYRYAWTEEPGGVASEIRFAVTETAREVSKRHLRVGRFKEAAVAARAGLRCDDADPDLIKLLLEATKKFNQPEAVSIAEKCRDLSDKLDGLDQETDALISEILQSA